MFAILLDVFYASVSWLFRTVILKFVLYSVLLFFIGDVTQYLSSLLPSGDGGLSSSFSGWTSSMWYFFDLFNLGVGLPAILSAFVLRFAIRRIPFFG